MNDVIHQLRDRKSVRAYLDKPIAPEDRRAILEAATPAVVVLAGKGAEQQQKRKHGPEPCVPDALLARRTLKHYDP